VRSLFAAQPKVSFAVDLFTELVQGHEWQLLAEQARRHLDNPDTATQGQARRMLAFALAHSTEDSDRKEAVRVYENLVRDGVAQVQDCSNLISLLIDMDRLVEAKIVVLQSIAASPREALEPLRDVGQRIVARTGDREFRERLEAAIAERGGHD
jgi:hypothetical protein